MLTEDAKALIEKKSGIKEKKKCPLVIKAKRKLADEVCYEIGEWYLEWKNKICDYKTRTHMLGYAKEELKLRLCKIIEA